MNLDKKRNFVINYIIKNNSNDYIIKLLGNIDIKTYTMFNEWFDNNRKFDKKFFNIINNNLNDDKINEIFQYIKTINKKI